jgi:stage IV sporulation protein FB
VRRTPGNDDGFSKGFGDAEPDDGASRERFGGQGFTGSWTRVRPSFDDPMSWSLPLFRAFGIDVRIHLFFLLLIAWQILDATWPLATGTGSAKLGIEYVLTRIAVVFGIVLLHEFGHAFACRRWGGTADEILMWPLGGLAYCAPPQAWQAHLATAVGGPMVNVLLLVTVGPILGLLTGEWSRVLLPNPISFNPPLAVYESFGIFILFAIQWFSLVLLLFNLLPLYPLDGGRILQALLWPRVGYARSVRYACRAGFCGAIALVILAALTMNMSLFAIGLFGGFTCLATLRRLNETESMLGFEDSEGSAFAASAQMRESEEERKERDAERARKAKAIEDEARQAAEFDRILDKIRVEGMQSLTGAERAVLQKETEKRRRNA